MKKKKQPHNRKAPTLLSFTEIQVKILKIDHLTKQSGLNSYNIHWCICKATETLM